MRTAIARLFVAWVVGAWLVGCTFNATNPASNPELNAEAQRVFADLTEGRADALVARMSSVNAPDQVRAQLPLIQTLVPSGKPPEGVVVGSRNDVGTGGTTYSVAQDYIYPDRVAHVATHFIKEGEAWKVLSFKVNLEMKPVVAPETAKPVAKN